MEDPAGYAFIWIGIITLLGLMLTGVLAFIFAVPAGVLITNLVSKFKKKQ